MYHAPAVTYPLGRTSALQWALWLLWLVGGLPVIWMLFEALALQGSAQAAIISVVICAFTWIGAGWALRRFWAAQQPARALRWDGADWWLELSPPAHGAPDAGPGRAVVRLDLQRCLLLHWRAEGKRQSRWLWAERAGDPARWHLLRCALYSKTPHPAHDAVATVTPRA